MKITLRNTGIPWDELIWVDNGTNPDDLENMKFFMKEFQPTSTCLHSSNTGSARGFNTAFSLSRSDYVVIMAPDLIMPDQWLKTMMEYVNTIPQTGIASVYSKPIEETPERFRGHNRVEMLNGLPILKSMPMDIFIFKRSLFSKVGYMREDFGPYGWSDVEWCLRCERILPELSYIFYTIPEMIVNHLGIEGVAHYQHKPDTDSVEYWEWKKKEASSQRNADVMEKCRKANYPYYSPF